MQGTLSKAGLICRYAVCLALLVVCAQITVPLPLTPVPVTLATFMIFTVGGFLGAKHGTLCVCLYVLMGLIGLPVFAGFKSLSALVGPTGGYILGYLPMTAIVGATVSKFSSHILRFAGMAVGLVVLYLFGAAWYSYIMSVGFIEALLLTAVPFIAADVFKMILSYLVVLRLKKFAKEQN